MIGTIAAHRAPVPSEEWLMFAQPLGARMSAPVDLNHPGHYLHWGWLQISVANVVVIAIMIALFALAMLLPFPKGPKR